MVYSPKPKLVRKVFLDMKFEGNEICVLNKVVRKLVPKINGEGYRYFDDVLA